MHDPIAQFTAWYADAKNHPAIADASAMTLATATLGGKPAARMVLLKEHGPHGFVFYGNMNSRKFRELKANPQAALCWYWPALDRQIRVEGAVAPVSDAEADAYFASRERGKQIGAWASDQSAPMPNRDAFEENIAALTRVYDGKPVPRPPHWSGWRLSATYIEFWSQGNHRLHAREVYTRADAGAAWGHRLLYP